jgi:nitrilase
METKKLTKVSAVHAAPVYLDKDKTTKKIIEFIIKASKENSKIVVFPETYLPGFPIWNALDTPINNHEFFVQYQKNSVEIGGNEIKNIAEAAKKNHIIVSLGFSEKVNYSSGCLFNSNILIDEKGEIKVHHRKMVPTFFEKLTWSNGDSKGLEVFDSPIGKIGALICGENTNPLARYSFIAQGEQIHISSYPPIWPTHTPNSTDRYDLASAIRIRAGAHSFEGKLFNIVSSSIVDAETKSILNKSINNAETIIQNSPKGLSMIVGPDGLPIKEISSENDQILSAEIDLTKTIVAKQFHDLSGYYNRFDIFDLKVNRFRTKPINFNNEK